MPSIKAYSENALILERVCLYARDDCVIRVLFSVQNYGKNKNLFLT
jgi:hypothetical protein